VSVIVEHGGGGSAVAAPIARDILLRAMHGDLPPLAAYPSHLRNAIGRERDALELLPPIQPTQGRSRA
jgi:penicillin-binding protein 2